MWAYKFEKGLMTGTHVEEHSQQHITKGLGIPLNATISWSENCQQKAWKTVEVYFLKRNVTGKITCPHRVHCAHYNMPAKSGMQLNHH